MGERQTRATMTATVTLLVKLLGIGLEFPRIKFLFRRTVEKGARAIMTATPFHEPSPTRWAGGRLW